MGVKVGDLFATLGLDTKPFDEGLKKSEENAGGFGTRVGNVLKVGFVAGTAALTGFGAKIGGEFLEADSAMADFAAKAGLTEEQTKTLSSALTDLYKSNLESKTGISQVMEGLVSLQEISADNTVQLKGLTQQYLDFALASGQDAAGAVADFDDILDAWNMTADDAGVIMDKLIIGHQKFGLNVQASQGVLNSLSPTFQALGLTMDDALGYLNLFAASGLNAEATTGAFNKAVALLTDGTDASNQKLSDMATKMGLTGDALAAFMASDPASQFDTLTKAISTIQDPAERASLAIDLFGTRGGTRLGQALSDAGGDLSKFQVSLDDSAGAAEDAANKIEGSFTNKVKLLSHQVLGTLQEKLTPIAPLLMALGVAGPIAATGIGAITSAMVTLAANPIVLVIAAIVAALVLLELKTHVLSEVVLPALIDAFSYVADVVKTDVIPFVENKLIPALEKLAKDVLERWLIPALVTLQQGWDDLYPSLKDAARVFEQDILPAVEEVATAIGETLIPVMQAIGQFLIDHPPLLAALAAAILLLIAPWLAVVAAIVVVLAKWDDIKAMFTVTIPEAIDSVVTKIEELPIIGTIFTGVMDSIKTVVETTFKLVYTYVETQINAVRDIIDIVTALISGDWSAAWEGVKQLLSDVLDGIVTMVTTWTGMVVTLWGTFLTTIVGVITDAAPLLLAAFVAALAAVWQAIQDWWEPVLVFWLTLPFQILQAIGPLAETLVPIAIDLMTGFLTAASGFFTNTIVPWLAGMPGAAASAIGDVTQTLVVKGGELLASLLTGAIGEVPYIALWFTGLPAMIVGWVGDLAGLLKEAGKAAIRSLKDGANAVKDEVIGVFEDIGHEIKDGATFGLGVLGDPWSPWARAAGHAIVYDVGWGAGTAVDGTVRTVAGYGQNIANGFSDAIVEGMGRGGGEINAAIGDLGKTAFGGHGGGWRQQGQDAANDWLQGATDALRGGGDAIAGALPQMGGTGGGGGNQGGYGGSTGGGGGGNEGGPKDYPDIAKGARLGHSGGIHHVSMFDLMPGGLRSAIDGLIDAYNGSGMSIGNFRHATQDIGRFGGSGPFRRTVDDIMAAYSNWSDFSYGYGFGQGGSGGKTGPFHKLLEAFGLPKSFDLGGWLMPGVTLAVNRTGAPERVLSGSDRPSVVIDMRGAQMTGTPRENERMMERVVDRVIERHWGVGALQHGVPA